MIDWDAVAGFGILGVVIGILGSGIALMLGLSPGYMVLLEWVGMVLVVLGIIKDRQKVTVEERILGEGD